ncbi:MAG: VWA domain-containing protein [Bdellovibrionota bacterium]
MIIALAGPSWKTKEIPSFKNNSSLIIVLDLSSSMNATDIKPTRLQRAKFAIEDLLAQRKDGQTGLVVYAGDAFEVSPLTADTETILAQLPVLNTLIMPEQGSQTDRAIDQSIELLQQAGQMRGDILFVSDEIEKKYISAAEKAVSQGYRVSVLAVGTKQGAPFLVGQDMLKDSSGNPVIAKLDVEEMKNFSTKGNGLYFDISKDMKAVDRLQQYFNEHSDISKKSEINFHVQNRQQEGAWFVLLALPGLLFLFRKNIFSVLAVFLMATFFHVDASYALTWDDLWKTKDQQASQMMQNNQFEQAAKAFQDKRWKQAAHYKAKKYQEAIDSMDVPTSSDDWYNRGNILAKMGQIDPAIQAYEQSLQLEPHNSDAAYNKKILEDWKKKQKDNQKSGDGKEKNQNKQDGQKDSAESDQLSEEQGDHDNKPQNNDSEQKQSDAHEKNQDDDKQVSENELKQTTSDEQDQKEDELKQQDEQYAENQRQDAMNQDHPDHDLNDQEGNLSTARLSPNEKEEAKKQWLRRVPDDPSLLWKRKFLYQYQKRNKKTNQDQGEKQW